MAKRKKEELTRTLTLTSGHELHLIPVSRLAMEDARVAVRKEYEGQGEQLEPPTYAVSLSGGGEKEYHHDEKSITQDATDEAKAEWVAYQEVTGRLDVEENEATLAVLIEDGVREEPTEEWLKRMARRGVELPGDPWDLKVFYVMREYLRTTVDVQVFTASMMILAEGGMGVDEAMLDSVSEVFRIQIRKLSGAVLEEFARTLAEGGEAGDLVAQQGVLGGEGGADVGDVA